jgi:nitrogen regulatory protein PII 2
VKEIIAVIRTNQYYATKKALSDAGFSSLMEKDVLGRGKKMQEFTYNDARGGTAAPMEIIAKKLLNIYVRDEDADRVIEVILSVNSTGRPGDGKIFVSPADEVYRIRTGQRGEDAIM